MNQWIILWAETLAKYCFHSDIFMIFTSVRDVKQSLTGCYVSIIFLYQSFLTNFGALYLTEFLTDFGQILDSKSYDQA